MPKLRNPEPIINELEKWFSILEESANDFGFDLSSDDDIKRIESIAYAESISRTDSIKANKIPDWVRSSPTERSFAHAYHRAISVMSMINDQTPDDNSCPCCNSDATAISELTRIAFLCGYLRLPQIDNIVEWENSFVLSGIGINAVSHRDDQKLKPLWIEHCKKAIASNLNINTLDDLLNINGYDPSISKIAPRTLKAWARLTGITFKAGRPKK